MVALLFRTKSPLKAGFTLVELSIVLVIVGLVIGGLLVGRDLISAAGVRAQISQIEKYITAVNTFRGKYGYLPGDIPEPAATQYGFKTRGQYAGEGDGNGVLEGVWQDAAGSNSGLDLSSGETAMFWGDLGQANLVDGGFSFASPTAQPAANITAATSPPLSSYFPPAKIGGANYVYAWSGGWQIENVTDLTDRTNYFGISVIQTLYPPGVVTSNPGLTVQQAYSIDTKIDDGLPQSGKVLAFNGGRGFWAAGSPAVVGAFSFAGGGSNPGFLGPTTVATPYAVTDCYDNNNVAGPQQYAMANADILNCALSIKFQ